jgi:hypothetical protein
VCYVKTNHSMSAILSVAKLFIISTSSRGVYVAHV